jgi:hypothetical protein
MNEKPFILIVPVYTPGTCQIKLYKWFSINTVRYLRPSDHQASTK